MDIKLEIQQYLKKYSRVNIILAGITCSGKTTLANQLRRFLEKEYTVTIVSQDDYFKNLPAIPRTRGGYLTDSIEAFHTLEFQQDVQLLFQNKVVMMPRYAMASNTRISKNKIVRLGQVNIFEGLHTISLLRGLENSIKLYVDTNPNLCLKRRIARDTSKYGIPEARIREYWRECIQPMCKQFIFPQKQEADILLTTEENEVTTLD